MPDNRPVRDKEARLAKALRDNLARRKLQQRARKPEREKDPAPSGTDGSRRT